ncbi:MAG: toll/interleukin-1 receptor domain-containing protein [Acidobacteriia bacterium]|nr:toll/interleukin-1 receptor domain-containing protein [Terriglobia bacterium]
MAKANQSSRLRVFLCHASEDKDRVRELYSTLARLKTDPWLDEKKLLPGQDWLTEITEAIRQSHVILVCISKNSVFKEGTVQRELKLALDMAEEKPEGAIYLIPVRLEQCDLPNRLRHLQWVDLFKADWMPRLFRALEQRSSALGIAWPRDPDGSGARAPAFTVLSDGSEFAEDLATVAQTAGFLRVTDPAWSSLDAGEKAYDLLLIVRGDEFFRPGDERFYRRVRAYVEHGGLVLATPWVSWETRQNGAFRHFLPFEYVNDQYFEDRPLSVFRNDAEPVSASFPQQFQIRASYEQLLTKEGSVVLLSATEGGGTPIPFFGYRRTGAGALYYLNCCQHDCGGGMPSPLDSEPLRTGLGVFLASVHDEIAAINRASAEPVVTRPLHFSSHGEMQRPGLAEAADE